MAGGMGYLGINSMRKPHYKDSIIRLEGEAAALRKRANTLTFTPTLRGVGQGLTFGATVRYSF